MKKIAIVGAGGFGTCLAILLATLGHKVTLYDRSGKIVSSCQGKRRNMRYPWLKKIRLPEGLIVELTPTPIPEGFDFTIIATSTAGISDTLARVASPDTTVVLIQKGLIGIEHAKAGEPLWTTPYDVARKSAPHNPILTFTGAAFAWQLLGKTNIKMLIGYDDQHLASAERFAELFEGSVVLTRLVSAPADAEVMGSVRVAASVAAGIFTGFVGDTNRGTCSLGFSEILTEALRWASSDAFAISLRPSDQTLRVFMSDYYLCFDKGSRNFNLGRLIAKMNLKKAQKQAQKLGVAEAIRTVAIIHGTLANTLVSGSLPETFPYLHCLNAVLAGKMSTEEAHRFMLSRERSN